MREKATVSSGFTPSGELSDSELYKLFVAPRNNGKYLKCYVNTELYYLVKELCKKRRISVNALIKLLLISAVKGEININVVINKHEIKTEGVSLNLRKVDENRRKAEEAKAERLIVKAQEVLDRFYENLEKQRNQVYRLDSYSKSTNRLLVWKRKAEEILIEIEKTLDKTSTPEVIDQLTEYHQALLKILKTKI